VRRRRRAGRRDRGTVDETTTTAPAVDETTTTAASEPAWDGDAEAAVDAVQSHLETVHGSADYYASITGVSVDPATGVGVIETSLTDEPDAADLALAACGDAATVAWGEPANLARLDAADGNGNVLATGTLADGCASA
jgi:hypothetical protein